MNNEIKKKVQNKNMCFRRLLNNRCKANRDKLARASNQARWSTEKAVRTFERKIADEAKSNPKAFYAYAKSKTTVKDSIGNLKTAAGDISDDKGKAETLNRFF